jgi:transposase InsO family protein
LNHIQRLFQNHWLSRYPWPTQCVHNNEGEFIGWEFQQLLERTGVQDRYTTLRNPQSNAVCERMHQTVGNILRTLMHGNEVNNQEQATTIIDNALAMAMHVTRSAVSRTLGNKSAGTLAFHRHMFLNLPFQADLQAIQQRIQLFVDENLQRQNARQRHYDYQVRQQVLVKTVGPGKLGEMTTGPFGIVQVHANGTLTIRRTAHVLERINLPRVFPFIS